MTAIAVRFAGIRPGLPVAVAISISVCMWAADSRAYTFAQQQACMGDAFRLCGSEIPDVDRVKACMIRLQSQLSPACRVYFRPEPAEPALAASTSFGPAHVRKVRRPKRPVQHDET
jgi:hypothetical protein